MQQFLGFIVNHWLLFLALVVIVAMLIMTMARARLLGFQELKAGDAVQLINHKDPLVLDVREADEYKNGHIQGAVHIPVGELEERIDELQTSRERPILIYCRAGQRSAQAAAVLKRREFSQIYKLDGGIMAWQAAHLPVGHPD